MALAPVSPSPVSLSLPRYQVSNHILTYKVMLIIQATLHVDTSLSLLKYVAPLLKPHHQGSFQMSWSHWFLATFKPCLPLPFVSAISCRETVQSSEVRTSEFAFWFPSLLAPWWANHLTFLHLIFLTYKIEVVVRPTTKDHCKSRMKCSEQCLPYSKGSLSISHCQTSFKGNYWHFLCTSCNFLPHAFLILYFVFRMFSSIFHLCLFKSYSFYIHALHVALRVALRQTPKTWCFSFP